MNDNFIKQHTDELIARYPSLASVRDNFIEGYDEKVPNSNLPPEVIAFRIKSLAGISPRG